MRKIFLFLTLFFTSIFAADFHLSEYKTPLINAENGFGEISDNPSLIIGSSGVVMHDFGNGEISIIARAVVTEKNGKTAKVRFEAFSMVKQDALPLPKILPASGDQVILNFLYDRALIVVPNESIYAQIIKAFPNITFVHPDLNGAYLKYNYKPNPSRDDFRQMCAKNATGLIFIALDGRSMFADCGSFKILKEFKSGVVSSYQLPFYTRVDNIKTLIWDFTNGPINDYDRHYGYLLGLDDEQ